jgi:hypothetical protein
MVGDRVFDGCIVAYDVYWNVIGKNMLEWILRFRRLRSHHISYPHNQHPDEHEDDWHHILEYPGPSVSHEVQSSFVEQG